MIIRTLGMALLLGATACNGDTAPDHQQSQAAREAAQSDASTGGVILQYHHVAADTPAVTSIEPDQFRRHLEYLDNNDYEIWPLDRLVHAVRDGEQVPENVVTITFDDAYLNIYAKGFPMLKEKGWPFTIFVATELIGTNDAQYLTWEKLAEMQDAGALIANHTHSHTHLLRKKAGESDADWKDRVRMEITRAAREIEENLGTTTDLFAYPYGEYNEDVLAIVEDLGYVGFGQQSGPIGEHSNFLVLPRFPMSGRYSNLEEMKTKLDTLPMPVADSDVDPLLPLSVTRPELQLNFTHGGLRFDNLVCYGPSGTTELRREGELTFIARAKSPVPVGRSRYNCTMPDVEGRFYWFSQLWIRREADGSWYPEP